MAFPSLIAQTFIENWPDEVAELSFRQEKIILSAEDTIALGACTPQFRETMKAHGSYTLSTQFLAALDKAMARFPDGAMPRIGYCSWKDSCLLNEPARSARQVLSIITRPNPRVAAALQQNAVHGHETAFFLRQWVAIPPWSEFRMFMRNRKFYGISQYYYRDLFPEIERNLSAICKALFEFCAKFRHISHMETVIVDVFLRPSADGLDACLIELNPHNPRADPCFYSWEGAGDFDGRLRFRNTQGQVVTVRLAA